MRSELIKLKKKKKRREQGHEFEKEKREVYGRDWREGRRWYDYILISKIKIK